MKHPLDPPGPDLDRSDPQLDRLLSHLAAAQAPTGLNDRLLHKLAQRKAAIPTQNATSVPFLVARKNAWALFLATAAIAALLVFLRLPSRHAYPGTPPGSQTAHTGAAPEPDPLGPLPPGNVTLPPSPLNTSPLIAEHHPRPTPTATPAKTPIPAPGENLSPEEARALDDLHAPSQPAPPMPLSAQERLMTRLARKDNGMQLAQIAPDPAQSFPGVEKAAFQRFFDPPPIPQPQDLPSALSSPPSSALSPAPPSPPSQGKLP